MVADGPHDGGTASENDIESTADPPITISIDAPLSSTNNKHLSAEPPRWRFVADAKKTTLAAGQYIAGKSSEELAAKYVAPDVSLYKAKGEKPDVGKLQHQPHANNYYFAEDLKVGQSKLLSNDNDAPSDLNTEVEKLETKPKEEDDLSQLQTDDVPANKFEEGSHQGDDKNKLDGESPTCFKSNGEIPSGTDSTPDQNEGGRLCDHLDEEDRKEDINLNSPEVSCEEDIDDSAKESNPRRGHRFLYSVVLLLLALVIVLGVLLGKKNNSNKSSATTSNNAATSPYVSSPIIIVNDTSWPSSYPSVVITTLSNGPSTTPSPAPSAECNSETKAFSIEHPKEGNIIESTLFGSSSHATWILKNACSGEVISQCHPCSLGSLSLTSSKPNLSMKGGADKNASTRRTEQQLLQNIKECLPINNEYVFEVQSTRVSESCCSFDPGSFILSFDNVVLTHAVSDGSDAYDYDWPTTYFFGESETACNKAEVKTSSSPTKSASQKPSLVLSEEPSYVPSRVRSIAPSVSPVTNSPTLVPTTRPVTFNPSEAPTSVSPTKALASQPTTIPSLEPIAARPTTSPLASLGACPETYGHFSSYTIGARVESNGFVYQCITVSCRSYGLEPGRRWKIVGSCSNRTASPTVSPSTSPLRIATTSPSKAPIDPPSASPSERPSNSPMKQPSASPFASPTKAPALPTISPSKSPSWIPTKNPSKATTQRPSTSSSRRPSTSPIKHPSISPNASPTISPRGSPSKAPSQLPTGSPSDGPIYRPTTSPIDKPTISPIKHPSAVPSKHPSTSPSKNPSANPSTVPTSKPTFSPTNTSLKPTCSADQEPFSLCLAINMSGSICNSYTGDLCIGCPQIIASFDVQESFCRDVGVSWRSCCSNFAYVKELTTLIVNSLGDLPVDKSFSVVQFASDARVVSGLSSTAQTLSTIRQLTYSGGLDNHADAIQTCEQSLSSSFNEKKMIMLITDGETGVPASVPEGATESAATSAKNKGTIIFPVLVPPDAPDTNEGSIPLLSRISSSGKVFDFTDDDVSSYLQSQEELLNHVLCS